MNEYSKNNLLPTLILLFCLNKHGKNPLGKNIFFNYSIQNF